MTERVLGPTGRHKRRRLGLLAALSALAVALVVGVTAAVSANTLGGNFEIDANANLTRENAAPSIDWVSVDEPRKADLATGSTDDSYGGGSKEDDTCPSTGTGSIPNNKSDLLNFGVYVEDAGPGSAGFLNLFWKRVLEPSGTTLMDFEFNQSQTDCGNGVNPVRTQGDLLIEYRLENGGSVATLKVREWSGSAWGAAVDLGADAIGTTNSTTILAANSDGLGQMVARTFGEASIDLDAIFEEGKCQSFGSAFLKSRASDSFTSQMKDFIKPLPVSITNCGSVLIKKEAEGSGTALSGATFTITPGEVDANGDEAASSDIPESDVDGYYCIENILIDAAGETHEVEETAAPDGYNLPDDPTQDIQVTETSSCADRLDDEPIVPDHTFVDPPEVGAILITKTGKDKACVAEDDPDASCSGASTRLLAGAVFEIFTGENSSTGKIGGDRTTLADGTVCIADLALGKYTVHEKTAPAGYQKAADQNVTVTEGTCASGAVAANVTDQPLTDVQVIVTPQLAGTTASKITCDSGTSDDATPGDVYDDEDETFTSIVPKTVTCTIVIDP